MDLHPQEIQRVLDLKGVTHLFHANTVATSRSLLKLKSFASRYMVQEHCLPQTSQYTDEIDQRYDIWDCAFFDSVDIHDRVKKINKYGPVLFKVPVSILTSGELRAVRVTKSNPCKWDSLNEDQRWFSSIGELEAGFAVGKFDHIIVIPNPRFNISIGVYTEAVILDQPAALLDGADAYTLAEHALRESADAASLQNIQFSQRVCREGCKCRNDYAADSALVWRLFNPTV